MHLGTRITLTPDYLTNFQCIGSDCEDTCCKDWRIDIDSDTYKKYDSINDLSLKNLIKNNIKKSSSKDRFKYGHISLTCKNECPFLDKDKMCSIHLNLGEEFLSNTCYIYPRVINEYNNTYEKSLSLSCPEAARKILMNEKGIEFNYNYEPENTRGFVSKRITPDYNKENNLILWDLRALSIAIIQKRELHIEDRLILLGIFSSKIKEASSGSKKGNLVKILDEFKLFLEQEDLTSILHGLNGNSKIKIDLTNFLIEYRVKQGIKYERFIDVINEMAKALEMTSDTNMERSIDLYGIYYSKYYRPFIQKHEYIFENYLVNHIFKDMYPNSVNKMFDEYLKIVINFTMIKMILVGVSGYNKLLNFDTVVKVFQSFSKTVEHNGDFYNKVNKIFKGNMLDEMSYLTILIKE